MQAVVRIESSFPAPEGRIPSPARISRYRDFCNRPYECPNGKWQPIDVSQVTEDPAELRIPR
jgi:hypothetical protein